MSSPIPLGIQNPLGPSKPLGRDRRLSTVFLPEHFARAASEAVTTQPTDSAVNVEDNEREERSQYRTKHDSPTGSANNSDRSSLNVWPTVVQSLSQIQPLNQSTMEISSAIAPDIASDIASDIVFDRPGSNKSLVPLQNSNSEVPTSWSSLAELVENTLEEIDEEEIIFTPTGFQRQTRDESDRASGSTTASSPPEDTYSPSVTQPVTLTSPYVSPEPEQPENLDAIVSEVYRRIIDRLQIERERNGRLYSGRLPW